MIDWLKVISRSSSFPTKGPDGIMQGHVFCPGLLLVGVCLFCWLLRFVVGLVTRSKTWWRHQMETFPVLLAICVGNSLVNDELASQRPVMRSFDVFFDLRLNKRLSKQSRGWWFETPSCLLWHHCNEKKVSRDSYDSWNSHCYPSVLFT